MQKIAILYVSYHHRNTKKVVEVLSDRLNAQLIEFNKDKFFDISKYDVIIIASGIYFNMMHQSLIDYIKKTDLSNKKIILLYTCGIRYRDYTKKIRQMITDNKGIYLTTVSCRGYDTYGLLQKIGGIAKNHPSSNDINKIEVKIKKAMI